MQNRAQSVHESKTLLGHSFFGACLESLLLLATHLCNRPAMEAMESVSRVPVNPTCNNEDLSYLQPGQTVAQNLAAVKHHIGKTSWHQPSHPQVIL